MLLTPFLGFPSSFKNFSVSACGVFVILLAFIYARDKRMGMAGMEDGGRQYSRADENDEISTDVYIQNAAVSRTPRIAHTAHTHTDERYTDIEDIKSRSKNNS